MEEALSEDYSLHHLITLTTIVTPYLVIIEINFIIHLPLSILFLQCWKSLRKKHTVQLHSLPADQADLEIVLSADCLKNQER